VERALRALAGPSEDGARELVACWLPVEEAYTECLDRELSCWSVQASTAACTRDYEAAITLCNAESSVAAALGQLCPIK
jgi:hypothetical protein